MARHHSRGQATWPCAIPYRSALAVLLLLASAHAAAQSADLAITKTDGALQYTRGQNVVYTITASNLGPNAAIGATVTDALPAGIATASWTCAGAGGGTCSASGTGAINDTVNLLNGASVTYTFTLTVPLSHTGPLSNTASIAPPAGTTDPDGGNDSATDIDVQAAEPDLQMDKSAAPASVPTGGLVTYTLAVSNAGGADATNAVVTDAPGVGLDCLEAGLSRTCSPAGGATCPASVDAAQLLGAGLIVPSLPAGGSVQIVFECRVTASGQ